MLRNTPRICLPPLQRSALIRLPGTTGFYNTGAMTMNKLFVVILAVAAFGLAGCDWFKSSSSTDPVVEANTAETAPAVEAAH